MVQISARKLQDEGWIPTLFRFSTDSLGVVVGYTKHWKGLTLQLRPPREDDFPMDYLILRVLLLPYDKRFSVTSMDGVYKRAEEAYNEVSTSPIYRNLLNLQNPEKATSNLENND